MMMRRSTRHPLVMCSQGSRNRLPSATSSRASPRCDGLRRDTGTHFHIPKREDAPRIAN